MLRFLSAVPFLAPARSIADGGNGTLGADVVGPHELRPGAVARSHMAALAEARVLGRGAAAGAGAPEALDPQALHALLRNADPVIRLPRALDLPAVGIPTAAEAVAAAGYAEAGDGGGGLYAPVASQPAHDGWFQSADGRYWELAAEDPTPRQFGAVWDGVNDDSAAIQACAVYCHVTRRTMRLPAGAAFAGSSTLYFGGVRVRGAGRAVNTGWLASRTVIRSNANPIISMARDAQTAQGFGSPDWRGFTIAAAGGAVAPIELWDYPDYPYQVGIWLGRGHGHIQTISAGEPSVSGGAGVVLLRDVGIEDVGGWGIVCYKLWGDSALENVYMRRVGGRAAHLLGDDALGGAILIASVTTDVTFRGVHALNGSHDKGVYATSAYDDTGVFVRIGADKAVTDGLDRRYNSPGDLAFERMHNESYARAMDIRAGKNIFWDRGNNNDGHVRIGYQGNPSTDLRVVLGANRQTGGSISVCQSPYVDLGRISNPTPGRVIPIRTWGPTRVEGVGEGLNAEDGWASSFSLEPQPDLSTAPGASPGLTDDRYRPLFRTGMRPASESANLLARFADGSGGALTGWGGSAPAGGTIAAEPHEVALSGGAEVRHDLAGLTPGDLFTVQFWARALASVGLGNSSYSVRDGSGTELLLRRLGSGPSAANQTWMRVFNVGVPADGVLQLRFYNADAGGLVFSRPILVRGALAPLGDAPPSVWTARDGAVVAG